MAKKKSEPITLTPGSHVANLAHLDWGLGLVISQSAETVTVWFKIQGEKRFKIDVAPLIGPGTYRELVPGEEGCEIQEPPDSDPSLIYLISKRGSSARAGMTCQQCKQRYATWEYAKSSHGRVRICESCKVDIFERSFGPADIQPLTVSGGRIGSNRRKH